MTCFFLLIIQIIGPDYLFDFVYIFSGTIDVIMGPKWAKPDDCGSDSPLSESKEPDEGENKHLCDISTQLSLILTAIHDLTDAVRETNWQ